MDAFTRWTASFDVKVNMRVNRVRSGPIITPLIDREEKGEDSLKKVF